MPRRRAPVESRALGIRATLVAASLALTAAPGCLIFGLVESLIPLGTYETHHYPKLTRQQLWEQTKYVVAKHFRVWDVDEEGYYLKSEWDVVLGVHYQTGTRRQLHVWAYESDKGPYLQIQCLREKNANIQHTLDAYEAEWESDGRDMSQEKLIEVGLDLSLGVMKESPTAGKPRPSPYLTQESDAEREKRLWGESKGGN